MRARGYITADARNQTEYGTVRGYIAVGCQQTSTVATVQQQLVQREPRLHPVGGLHVRSRAVVLRLLQRAGDVILGRISAAPTPVTAAWFVMAYTAQFGNGFSATIAAEAPRRTQIIEHTGGSARRRSVHSRVRTAASGADAGYGGFQAPDIVANLRVDQAWGSAQIMGAAAPGQAALLRRHRQLALPQNTGHPDDKLGFAVGAGIKLNAPMIGQGDYFQTQVNYTQGALRYIFQTPNGNWGIRGNQRWRRLWRHVDAVYGGTLGSLELQPTSS